MDPHGHPHGNADPLVVIFWPLLVFIVLGLALGFVAAKLHANRSG